MPHRFAKTSPRERLLKRRVELLTRYRQTLELSDEEANNRQIEQMETATDQWDVHVLSQLGEVEARELSLVIEALRRIADNTYGACLRCGEQIGPARLDVLPEAPMCIACANTAARSVA